MSFFRRNRIIATLFIFTVCVFVLHGPPLFAKDEAPSAPETAPDVEARLARLAEVQQLLKDNKLDEAKTALVDFAGGITPETALAIIRKVGYKPFEDLIRQGGEFRRAAYDISALARQAGFAELSDPEAVRQAVSDFLGKDETKSGPAYRLLKESIGEIGVQYLLEAWKASSDYGVKAQIQIGLMNMGPRVAPPVIAALDTDDAVLRGALIEILSQQADWRAAGKLREIAGDQNLTPETRRTAMTAADKIVQKHIGKPAEKCSASELYARIAEDYLAGARRVMPSSYLNEDARFFMWAMREGALVPTEAPRFAYNYEMAIQTAGEALRTDPGNQRALDIIACARLAEISAGRKILDYDAAMRNEILSSIEREKIAACTDAAERRPSVAALGLRALCGALHIALKYNLDDAAAACMEAVAAVPAAGDLDFIPAREAEINLDEKYGDSLTLALQVGGRRIRYGAAITLARIAAEKQFVNMKIVPDLLLKAMEEAGAATVLVVHSNAEARNTLRLNLAALGYDVLTAKDAAEGAARAKDFPAPDAVIVCNDLDGGADYFISTLRDTKSTAETPILVVSSVEAMEKDKLRFSHPNVKGFITDPADRQALGARMEAFKKIGSWEMKQSLSILNAAAAALASLDPSRTVIDLRPHVERIIALAQSNRDLTARVSAMTALGRWRFSAALKPAAIMLADSGAPPALRAAAARAIGNILLASKEVDEETFGILLAALEDKDPDVGAAAAGALATAPLAAGQRSRLPKY